MVSNSCQQLQLAEFKRLQRSETLNEQQGLYAEDFTANCADLIQPRSKDSC